MDKVCLVVIYNHNFEKNIPVIRRIYEGRFSNVYQVMPFYQGNDPDVIGVYEGSYQFNGYITQAAPKFVRDKYSHYVFVADDMVLNPELNEENIISQLKLGARNGLISSLGVLTDRLLFSWPQGRTGAMYLNGIGNACEWRRFMPSLLEARLKFEKAGLDWRKGASLKLLRLLGVGTRAMRLNPWQQALLPPLGLLKYFVGLFTRNRTSLDIASEVLAYPTAMGYSDFVVVPSCAMKNFCHYCGVFAAARQFVECAIPTALVLACDKVCTLSDIDWRYENGVDDYAVRKKLEQEAQYSYSELVKHYPNNYLFIHPVKLSKWKDLP